MCVLILMLMLMLILKFILNILQSLDIGTRPSSSSSTT